MSLSCKLSCPSLWEGRRHTAKAGTSIILIPLSLRLQEAAMGLRQVPARLHLDPVIVSQADLVLWEREVAHRSLLLAVVLCEGCAVLRARAVAHPRHRTL